MADQKPAWTDERSELVIGQLLRAGVLASAAIVLLGAILYLVQHGGEQADYRSFRGEPDDLRSLTGILKGAVMLRPREFIQFGVVLLLLTPVARVAFSVFAFAVQRDWTYVIVTLVVLAILVLSIVGHI